MFRRIWLFFFGRPATDVALDDWTLALYDIECFKSRYSHLYGVVDVTPQDLTMEEYLKRRA